MKANEIQNAINAIEVKNTAEVRRMPITKGMRLTFVPNAANVIEHDATEGISSWTGYLATDGTEISITALVRIGNGIVLEGTTPTTRLQYLFATYGDDETGSVVIDVTDIKQRGERFYPTFAVVK